MRGWYLAWKDRLIQVVVAGLLILSGLIRIGSAQVGAFLQSVGEELGSSPQVGDIIFLYSLPLRVVFLLRSVLGKLFSMGHRVFAPCEDFTKRLDNKLLYIRSQD